jgi:EAL domain-containing protein (putative c-di-GMP-specific phosphodiesterase class I)
MSNESSAARVLVVDDDAMVASTLTSLLTREGYRVDQFTVDVVLSDISMPGMTGIEMLEKLRALASDVPVVFMTGVPRIEDAMRAMELGAFRYLTKPVDRAVVVADRSELEASFNRALEGLKMAYQPIVSASDRVAFGYEALMRSSEPSLPSPPAVLEAAEKLGRLHSLGRQVRALVGRQASAQPFDHTFFVNLHSADLADPELFDPNGPLTPHAKAIVLELTERASLEGIGGIDQRLQSLRELGYRIAVDDLGAGYAGLSYFAKLKPDIVKIDMSLTRGIDTDVIKQRVVASMCQLARDLEMLIVAEGIETEAEFKRLADLGADLMQGYLIAKPGPYPPAPVKAA